MPKALEDKLKREAAKKFPHDPERRRRYVYGTLERLEQRQARKKAPMIVRQLWHDLDSWLAGKPDSTLTLLLILTALVGIAIALWGPRPLKPAVLLYWWLP